jgi:hypothetical protein
MANHHIKEDAYECNLFAIKAEGVVRELIKAARKVSQRGYGTTQLIFSDWSFVSITDSGLIGEVEALLRAGQQPWASLPRIANAIEIRWSNRGRRATAPHLLS